MRRSTRAPLLAVTAIVERRRNDGGGNVGAFNGQLRASGGLPTLNVRKANWVAESR